MNGIGYFYASNVTNGSELWRTDGTSSGTFLVRDIVPGTGSSLVSRMTALDNVLYFSASDGVNGTELWRSDGSSAGTYLLYDMSPGVNSSTIDTMTVYGNRMLVRATTIDYGNELWVTDGTSSGTFLLRDITPGTSSSSPSRLSPYDDRMVFTANESGTSTIWITDGTTAGTQKVTNSISTGFVEYQGNVYFGNNPQFYRTDGTSTGTSIVYSGAGFARELIVFDDKIFFSAGSHTNGFELWKSDGPVAAPSSFAKSPRDLLNLHQATSKSSATICTSVPLNRRPAGNCGAPMVPPRARN